jgi:hypothetical protein
MLPAPHHDYPLRLREKGRCFHLPAGGAVLSKLTKARFEKENALLRIFIKCSELGSSGRID